MLKKKVISTLHRQLENKSTQRGRQLFIISQKTQSERSSEKIEKKNKPRQLNWTFLLTTLTHHVTSGLHPPWHVGHTSEVLTWHQSLVWQQVYPWHHRNKYLLPGSRWTASKGSGSLRPPNTFNKPSLSIFETSLNWHILNYMVDSFLSLPQL